MVSGPAIQPEPETLSPHAVPSTCTALRDASCNSGSARIPFSGISTSALGPRRAGVGSIRLRTLSTGPDGGTTSFRALRIFERWTSARYSRSAGALSATAPITQLIASPSSAITIAPPIASITRRAPPATRRSRIAIPRPSSRTASTPPTSRPPSSAVAGA